jgi:hypothetical protein
MGVARRLLNFLLGRPGTPQLNVDRLSLNRIVSRDNRDFTPQIARGHFPRMSVSPMRMAPCCDHRIAIIDWTSSLPEPLLLT